MSQTITQGCLRINANFKRFVDEEVLPEQGWDAAAFWRNFDEEISLHDSRHQKIVSCWQNAIAFRRRLMSGIAAIRGR